MQNPLIAEIVKHYPSGAACASAPGIIRQAFNAALARGRLSTACALRAADILNTDPGAALLSNAKHPAPPIAKARPHPLYYVKSHQRKPSDQNNGGYHPAMQNNIHVITSQKQNYAVDLIRWVLAVAKLPADSPRFNWYVSRWAVPDKIARAKLDGNFSALVSNCPPIDPAWVRLVPAALAACDDFKAQTLQARPPTRAISPIKPPPRKALALAA